MCSTEKKHSGADGVDLEFRKRFEHGHFDPNGQSVAEQLVDDRIHAELGLRDGVRRCEQLYVARRPGVRGHVWPCSQGDAARRRSCLAA